MRPLTEKFADIMYGSDTAWGEHYPDKFCARRAVMLHAVNLGWSFQDCHLVFLNPLNPGSRLWTHGSNERLLGAAETTKRLMRDYEAATKQALRNPQYECAAEARQRIGEIQAAVHHCEWRGRTGRTDRDVLLTVLRHAAEVGTDRVDMSARAAAMDAGVTPPTASNALKRLCKAGWLECRAASDPRQAHSYKCRITKHMTLSERHIEEIHVFGNAAPSGSGSHECWVRLGKAARDLYYALAVAPASARRIAKLAKVHPSTADRNLPVLASFGLATGSAKQGWAVGPASPDGVVRDMGWIEGNSRVALRKAHVEAEREWWHRQSALQEGRASAGPAGVWLSDGVGCCVAVLAYNVAQAWATAP